VKKSDIGWGGETAALLAPLRLRAGVSDIAGHSDFVLLRAGLFSLLQGCQLPAGREGRSV
jgi:hypothetical protein